MFELRDLNNYFCNKISVVICNKRNKGLIVNAFRLTYVFSHMISLTSLKQTSLEANYYRLPLGYKMCGDSVNRSCVRCCEPTCKQIFNNFVLSDFYRTDGPEKEGEKQPCFQEYIQNFHFIE